MSDFFKGIDPVPVQGAGQRRSAGLPLLREGPDGARQADATTTCAWRSPTGTRSPGRAAIPSAGRPSSGRGSTRGWRRRSSRPRSPSRCSRILGADVLLLPRPRHRARGQEPRRERSQRPGDRRHLRAEDGGDRGRLAVGDGQPVLQPPLHGGGGDQSRPGRVCLRGGAGEELPRRHARPQGRELRAVGRARGLRDAAQHRHEAGARPDGPLPVDGGRVQAQDRLSRARS